MSYVKRHRIAVTTDASGDAVYYTPIVTGKLISITYTKDDFSDGVDFTITGETTGINLWTQENVNATATVAPKMATHSQAGVANNTAGDVLLSDIYLAQERIKLVVANGGETKDGTFDILIAGPTG